MWVFVCMTLPKLADCMTRPAQLKYLIAVSWKVWQALSLANWLSIGIGESQLTSQCHRCMCSNLFLASFLIWRSLLNSPNRQIKNLAQVSPYMVPYYPMHITRDKAIGFIYCLSVIITKVARTCKRNKSQNQQKNSLRYTSNHSAQPTSIANDILLLAIVATPIDHSHCRP